MTVVLGVDLATADARVLALDADTGDVLAERRAPLTVIDRDGVREQPAEYGEVARALLAGVAHDLGDRAREVVALAVTGTSGTVVPTDAQGRPVGDALLYNDPRGAEQLAALGAAGRGVRPSGALARTAWMYADRPAERYVFTPDVVGAALAGRLLPSDTSHALKSGIDAAGAAWDAAALDALGLPREVLPELTAPGRVLGEVARADALGLPEGTVIVSGMTDGSTGQIATGAVAAGDSVAVLGTTLVLKAAWIADVVDNAAGIYSHVSPDGLFWPGGASNTGAAVLRHGLTAGYDPAAMTPDVDAFGDAPTVAYPLPRPGERFPVADGAFAGFSVDLDGVDRDATTPIERFRQVFEGVAFVERLGLERMASLGVRLERHHLAGGASANPLWNRIRASAIGRPVTVVGGASSARGAAMLAAAAWSGRPLAEVAAALVGSATVVDPDPALVAALQQRYDTFRAALAARTA